MQRKGFDWREKDLKYNLLTGPKKNKQVKIENFELENAKNIVRMTKRLSTIYDTYNSVICYIEIDPKIIASKTFI